jgi:hypothetical protein
MPQVIQTYIVVMGLNGVADSVFQQLLLATINHVLRHLSGTQTS